MFNRTLTKNEISYRVAQDLLKRAAFGPYAYPIFWPLIAVASNFHQSHPRTVLVVSILMVIFSLLRFLHARKLDQCFPDRINLWYRIYQMSAIPHALLWSLMFALSMTVDNSRFAVFMAFSTAGLIAGGTNSFAPDKFMSYAFVIVFILPPLGTSMFVPNQEVLTLMMIAFLVYSLSLSRNQQREYWQSLNNEMILAKQSRTDVLTQLDNRRYFDEKLNELCQLSSRNHDQLTVMIIDCDHFKAINDTYGHDVGDECLKHLAQTLSNTLTRTTDVCARYGGEEFSVILAGVDGAGAKIVAERTRQIIESTPYIGDNKTIVMTVSIGSVSRKLERFYQELPGELFKQADEALYLAKRSGRNRCVLSVYENESQGYVCDSIIDLSGYQKGPLVN